MTKRSKRKPSLTLLQIISTVQFDPSELHGVIHESLNALKEIAVIWAVEDVLEVRPDLNEDQAWEVLKMAEKYHDANCGICWESLDATADALFGVAPDAIVELEKETCQ